jgi:dTDP-4-dehydrorhamnose reductase
MTVMVTGAAGRLAGAIAAEFSPAGGVVALTRAELDVTDRAAVTAAVARHRPGVIINCAAFNDVDAAQRDPRAALEINALAVLHLARAASEADAAFVHYSTDFVFDGAAARPYTEDDQPRPLSFYGITKLLGEQFAREAARAYVLRVESIFGGPGSPARPGSIDTIVRRLRAGEEVPVFTDRIVSPSYAPDIARATRLLLETSAPSGLYHCVNAGHASWHDVAAETARLLGVAPRLRPILTDDVRMAAPRPRYCALDPGKIAAAGAPMRPWQDAVRDWLARAT